MLGGEAVLQPPLHDRVKQLSEDCEAALIHRHNTRLGHPGIPLNIDPGLNAPRQSRPRGGLDVLELDVHLRLLTQDLCYIGMVFGEVGEQGWTFLRADGSLKWLRTQSILLLKDRSPAGKSPFGSSDVRCRSRYMLGCVNLRPSRQRLICEYQPIAGQFHCCPIGRCQVVHQGLVLNETRARHCNRKLQGCTATRRVSREESQPGVLGEPLDLG
mmetsp:Transcript_40810/g.88894  ORF Transcript_40810/g.88894 Transcript_40810/m.88894 type:complete len:214 (-) Transcript_40810:431-1072(-)